MQGHRLQQETKHRTVREGFVLSPIPTTLSSHKKQHSVWNWSLISLGQMSQWSTCWKQLLNVQETNRGCIESVGEDNVRNILLLGNKSIILIAGEKV